MQTSEVQLQCFEQRLGGKNTQTADHKQFSSIAAVSVCAPVSGATLIQVPVVSRLIFCVAYSTAGRMLARRVLQIIDAHAMIDVLLM